MFKINLLKIFLISCYVFIPLYTFADDVCSKYKYDTDINVKNNTKYNPIIKYSNENMIGKLGEIQYQTSFSSKLLLINIPVKNGFCISLRSVDVDINVPEFIINIDKRLKKDSCAYKIVLKHEMDHMNVNKNIINNNIDNIKRAILNATKSTEPVFVSDIKNIEKVQSEIRDKIENFKEVKDIEEKLKIDVAKNNEDIDTRGDSFEIWKCEDFYKEMKNNRDTITID